MKNFDCTVSDRDLTTRKIMLRAEDRSAVIKVIKEKGSTPVTIKEVAEKKKPKYIVPIIAGSAVILVIVIAIAVFLLIKKPDNIPVNIDTPVVPATEHPVALPVTAVKANSPASAKPLQAVERISAASEKEQIVSANNIKEQKKNVVAAMPEPTAEPETPAKPVEPPRPFVETIISMIGKPGESMPPVPFTENDEFLNEDFAKAMDSTIEILESDDENAAQNKIYIAWIKEYIKEAQEVEGKTPAQFLKDLEAFRKEEAAIRSDAQKTYSEALKTMSAEDAENVRLELNENLAERGIPEIQSVEERRRMIRERKAAALEGK